MALKRTELLLSFGDDDDIVQLGESSLILINTVFSGAAIQRLGNSDFYVNLYLDAVVCEL